MVQTITFLVGGLGLFLYGMDLASQGLQKILAGRMRQLLVLLTQNRLTALLIGIFLTLCFQSSSATTVLLVSLASSNILNLGQTLGVILGADIGTTLTIQLIAFRIDHYALLIFALGVLIYFMAKYERTKFGAKILMGFGLIFYGMLLMKQGTSPLANNPTIVEGLLSLQQQPLLLLLSAMLLTAVIQSSAATIAIAFALMATTGTDGAPLLDFNGAIPVIFGANIGTCATAMLAGIRANQTGRQVALAHLIFKVGAVLLIFPFMNSFSHFVVSVSHTFGGESVSPIRLLANAHTLFNVGAALIFLPFIQWVPKLLEKTFPKKGRKKGEVQPILFNESLTRTPDLALEEANLEIQRMGKQVEHMLAQSLTIFEKEDSYLIEDLWRSDQVVDIRYSGLSAYLNRLSQAQLTEEEATKTRDCFLVMEELEHIGDIIARHLIPLAQKKLDRGVDFSIEGFHDIMKLHELVSSNLDSALKAHLKNDSQLAQKIIMGKSVLSQEIYQLRLNHLERLRKGLKETVETSSIHLDIISSFSQIKNHTMGIARIAAQELSPGKPRRE